MANFQTNIIFPRNPVQGDTLPITLIVNTDLTDYKIRCQITDSENNNVKVATTNAGGIYGEISININDLVSTVSIIIPKDETISLRENCNLEIEIEDLNEKVYTIVQMDFKLSEKKIGWTNL